MVMKMFDIASLGRRFVAAACVYTGLALIMMSVMPETPRALASDRCDGEYGSCGDGYYCRQGTAYLMITSAVAMSQPVHQQHARVARVALSIARAHRQSYAMSSMHSLKTQ
jgi:hypothetical protein